MNRTAEWASFLLLWLDSPTKTDNSYKYMYMLISNCGHNCHIDFLCRKNIKFYTRLFQYFNIRFNSYILRTIKLSVHLYKSWWKRKRERVFHTPPGPRHSCCGRGRTMICRLSSHHGRPTHTDCGRCIYMSPTTQTTTSYNLYTTHSIFISFCLDKKITILIDIFFTILNINQHLKYKSSMII